MIDKDLWFISAIFSSTTGLKLAGLVILCRVIVLNWIWTALVRRHLKEVSEMVNRPRLQTILSIMTANPFSPRPEVELSERPPPPSFD